MPKHIFPKGNKFGGRPKANHTLQAEQFKKRLIEKIIAKGDPIIDKLVNEALKGNFPALKEVLERSVGKVTESMEVNYGQETIAALKQQLKKLLSDDRKEKEKVS